MKSSQQKRQELKAERKARRDKTEGARAVALRASRERAGVLVDASQLAPDGSYSVPRYVELGYYEDVPYTCCECGKEEVWTATQQKWWYEVAKGQVWTTARRCRPCRQRESRRRSESRRVHLEGIARQAPTQLPHLEPSDTSTDQ